MASAESRGWGDPWASSFRTDNIVTVKVPTPQGATIALPVHRRVAPLFLAFLVEAQRAGYDLDDIADDWGYARRCQRGTGPGTRRPCVTSNHAWGLAIDINATENPMGSPLRTNMPGWLSDLAEKYGLSWGGKWSTPDPMHFEFLGTPGDADRLVAGLTRQEVEAMFDNHRFVRVDDDPARFYSWDPEDSSVYAWNGAPGPILSAEGQRKIREAGGIRNLAHVHGVGLSAVVGQPGQNASWAVWNFRDLGPGDRA